MRHGKKPTQLELRPRTWGGRREGAGRRRRSSSGVSHQSRPAHARRFPLHVTWRIRREVGNLRTDKRFLRIQRAFRYGGDRFGLRLIEFSVQSNHVHLIVEAEDRRALSRGLQGLAIRVARGVNRASNRRGRVLADRYHARALRTPTEVRRAVAYVLRNLQHHTHEDPRYVDPYSSMAGEAAWHLEPNGTSQLVTAPPRSWLLRRALVSVPHRSHPHSDSDVAYNRPRNVRWNKLR
jgi:putative transposase